jgi:hypothetical protein
VLVVGSSARAATAEATSIKAKNNCLMISSSRSASALFVYREGVARVAGMQRGVGGRDPAVSLANANPRHIRRDLTFFKK